MLNEFGTLKESNKLLYDSRDVRFKSPFGAVSTRQKVSITFPVTETLKVRRVSLFLRRNTGIKEYGLDKKFNADGYDVFGTEFMTEREGTYFYRFELYTESGVLYVGKGEGGKAIIGEWLPEWQLSVYQSAYKTADFIKGGVVYHIFCDRFCHAGSHVLPRYGILKEWNSDVTIRDPDGLYRANDFFGGNFKGIIEKLDYLSDLGVTVLYLSPIFESSSNHRYDTADYSKIDPLLGTEDDFKDLINKCDERGISVVLDGVFNHTGADSVYFNQLGHYKSIGACQSKNSPYYDWYTFFNYPNEYLCWWGIGNVPTVARDAEGFRNLIAGENGIIEKWTKMGVKGWRLDVVDELEGRFIDDIRRRVRACNSDGLIIGEVWEDASTKFSYGEEKEYFYGKELDGVMNYVYKEAILEYVMTNNGKKFVETVLTIMENYPIHTLDTCFTLLDSHDTVRVLNALSGVDGWKMSKEERRIYRLKKEQYETAKKRVKFASALQYFLPGVPSLYYGDEAGMQGFEDPINRRPYPWGNEDKDLIEHYKMLGMLRKNNRRDFIGSAKIKFDDGIVYITRGKFTLKANAEDCSFVITEKEKLSE